LWVFTSSFYRLLEFFFFILTSSTIKTFCFLYTQGIPISIYPMTPLNLFNFPLPRNLRPLTLRKNNPPAGRVMRWEPGRIFRGTPSLYHWMVGVGLPSALQLSVAGSCRGTVVSMGCSTIRGGWDPAKEKKIG